MTTAAPEKVDEQQLMDTLKKEWDALKKKEAESTSKMEDARAALLVRYEQQGLTQRKLARAVDISQGHIAYILRHQRFLMSTGHQSVSERTFRLFWQQVCDPEIKPSRNKDSLKSKEYTAYERKIFDTISEMIAQGKKPAREKKPKTRRPAVIKSVEDVRKTALEVYQRLRPTLRHLKELLGCHRSTFAPDIIAGHAQVLEREIRGLFRLLTGAEMNGEG